MGFCFFRLVVFSGRKKKNALISLFLASFRINRGKALRQSYAEEGKRAAVSMEGYVANVYQSSSSSSLSSINSIQMKTENQRPDICGATIWLFTNLAASVLRSK